MDLIRFAAVSRNYFNMPIWVAQNCGLFNEEGLKVEIELHEPIDEVTQRLQMGTVQLAFGVTEHVILDRENGGSLSIIGGNVNKLPFSLIATKSIRSPKDLQNKTIGVSSKMAGSSSLVMKILATYGLNYPDDYSLKEVGPILSRWEKLQTGEIDAGLQGVPLNYVAIDEGYVSLIEPRDHFPDFQFTSLHVDANWAKQNTKTLHKFMRAFIRAHRLFFENCNLMTEIAVKETKISRQYAQAAWKEYTSQNIFSPNGKVNIKGTQSLIDVSGLIRAVLKRKGAIAEEYIDTTFLSKALIDM